jgi:WD40 repeat protein
VLLLPIRAFRRSPRWLPLFAAVVLSVTSILPWAPKAAAATMPSGFQDQVVISNLIQPTSVAFSPDGKMLASGDDNGTIKLWRLTP